MWYIHTCTGYSAACTYVCPTSHSLEPWSHRPLPGVCALIGWCIPPNCQEWCWRWGHGKFCMVLACNILVPKQELQEIYIELHWGYMWWSPTEDQRDSNDGLEYSKLSILANYNIWLCVQHTPNWYCSWKFGMLPLILSLHYPNIVLHMYT